jgi:hypothetical protein
MNRKSFSVASLLLATASLGTAACDTLVTNGEGGGGGDGGAGGSGGNGGGGVQVSANTIAIAPDDLPDPNGGTGSSSSSTSTGGGNPVDPDSLVIFVASSNLTCADPPSTIFDLEGECPDDGGHLVRFTLAPEEQAVGVYSLQALNGFFEEILPNGDGTCGFGGGTFWDGSVEVVAVHDATIEITLSDTMSLSGESVDGSYVVPRCSAPQQPSPDAIAIFREDLPPSGGGGSSSVSTGGGSLPGDDLLLMTGSDTPVCSDPFASPGCETQGWGVTVILPAAYQTPGVYSLSDPAIISSFSVGLGSPGECAGGGGSYFDGSIEVVTIDDQQVVYTLSGTAELHSGFGNADGTYEASRCQ